MKERTNQNDGCNGSPVHPFALNKLCEETWECLSKTLFGTQKRKTPDLWCCTLLPDVDLVSHNLCES